MSRKTLENIVLHFIPRAPSRFIPIVHHVEKHYYLLSFSQLPFSCYAYGVNHVRAKFSCVGLRGSTQVQIEFQGVIYNNFAAAILFVGFSNIKSEDT